MNELVIVMTLNLIRRAATKVAVLWIRSPRTCMKAARTLILLLEVTTSSWPWPPPPSPPRCCCCCSPLLLADWIGTKWEFVSWPSWPSCECSWPWEWPWPCEWLLPCECPWPPCEWPWPWPPCEWPCAKDDVGRLHLHMPLCNTTAILQQTQMV